MAHLLVADLIRCEGRHWIGANTHLQQHLLEGKAGARQLGPLPPSAFGP